MVLHVLLDLGICYLVADLEVYRVQSGLMWLGMDYIPWMSF